jgi:hypothetical protein
MPTVPDGYYLAVSCGNGTHTGFVQITRSGAGITFSETDANNIVSVNTGGVPGVTYTWGYSSGTVTNYTVNLYSTGSPDTLLNTLTNTSATTATSYATSGTTYYTTVVANNSTTGNSAMVYSGPVTA